MYIFVMYTLFAVEIHYTPLPPLLQLWEQYVGKQARHVHL